MFVNPNFDFEKPLSHELAPFPTSLFDKVDILRTTKQKSKLTNALKTEANLRLSTTNFSKDFVDGCVVFWKARWSQRET